MIHIDRTRVARPAFLDGKEVQTARQKVAEYFSVPPKKRSQKTFVFPILYMATSIATALTQLFEHKCAFCESLILSDENAAAHFRPTDGAIGLDGKFSADHYWWLGFQWENLYAACSSCIRAKGLRFPVQGTRAKLGEPYEKVVASESPLLLDPCIDNPTEHLVFAMNGRVSSATERGRATIEIFALNRAALVQGRRQAMRETKKLLASGDPSQLTAASLSYTAARRQVLVPAKQVRGAKKVVRTASSQAAIHRDFAAYESSREEYSVEAAPSVDVSQLYFAKSRMIERIELQNIRLFSDLKIRLSPASETAPWLTLLGENGLGKSTILQAIALALMGDRLRAKFRFTPQSFLRYGDKLGAVRIYLTGVEQPIELIVTRDKFIGSDSAAKVLLLGYGSTRLFRRRGSKARGAAARHARVQNLFDPFALLKNPTTFFRGLTPDKRNAAARAAKTLLSLDDNVTIARATGERMVIVKNGTREAFDDLSDGYRTMLALASDIMAVMFDRWPDMKAAEGIVVVDELENH
ncbi:MAG TPA: AAA family ATPase, partial [Thermoanaerobaculia bacterium]